MIVEFVRKVLKILLFLNLSKIFMGSHFFCINLVFSEDIEISRVLSRCL